MTFKSTVFYINTIEYLIPNPIVYQSSQHVGVLNASLMVGGRDGRNAIKELKRAKEKEQI